MKYTEIVDKLIGPVSPIGETNEDIKRLTNLKELCELTDHLLTQLHEVAVCRHNNQYSMKRAGEFAYKFLEEVYHATAPVR